MSHTPQNNITLWNSVRDYRTQSLSVQYIICTVWIIFTDYLIRKLEYIRYTIYASVSDHCIQSFGLHTFYTAL